MRIVTPVSLTVNSTNVAASSLTEWSSATTYAVGNQVKYTTNQPVPHHEFESKQANNTNHAPVIGGTDWWLDLGATNQHKMFDDLNNSRTVATDSSGDIIVSFTPSGRVTTLALLGLRNVQSLTIKVVVGGVTMSENTYSQIDTLTPVGAFTFYFGEYLYMRSRVVDLFGFHYQPQITVTLTGVNTECGSCFAGFAYEIGDTEYGAQPGLVDYSTFEADTFGNTIFVPRQNARQVEFTVYVETYNIDRIFALCENIIGTLCLFDGNNSTYDSQHDSLRVYGKLDSFRPGLQYNKTAIDFRVLGTN